MKKYFSLLFLCLLFFNSCFYGGSDDDFTSEPATSSFEPVISSRENFESTISLIDSKPVLSSGKIYVQGDYLFINEPKNGFHIIDNSNPESPNSVAFLSIPLATDLAIRGNVIYVHHAVDLVALQYNPVANAIEVLHREKNVFPQLKSPDGYSASYYGVQENEIIIDYSSKN